jgi:hypothetical protein
MGCAVSNYRDVKQQERNVAASRCRAEDSEHEPAFRPACDFSVANLGQDLNSRISRLGRSRSKRRLDIQSKQKQHRPHRSQDRQGRGGGPSWPLALLRAGCGLRRCRDDRIDRVEVGSNRVVATIPTTIADSEGAIGVGEGGVWMLSDREGTLLHIDPLTNGIVSRTKTVAGAVAAAAGAGAVWVTSPEKDLLCRIDPRSHELVAQISVGPRPRFLAVGLGAEWTLNQGDGSVSRVDPRINQMVANIPAGIPGDGGDISIGEGFVWVTAKNAPSRRSIRSPTRSLCNSSARAVTLCALGGVRYGYAAFSCRKFGTLVQIFSRKPYITVPPSQRCR